MIAQVILTSLLSLGYNKIQNFTLPTVNYATVEKVTTNVSCKCDIMFLFLEEILL
jgi:hypothetical protein